MYVNTDEKPLVDSRFVSIKNNVVYYINVVLKINELYNYLLNLKF